MILRKTYLAVMLLAVFVGLTLLLGNTARVAAAAPTGIRKKGGYRVSVAQPPATSYADGQRHTKAAIDVMGGPVVLVGHSYGGSIISEAGNDPIVAALVYIAAFALDQGESCPSIETAVPQAFKAFKADNNGNVWIEQDHFAADFAADFPFAESHYLAIAQVPISTDSFTRKVTSPAWKNKPAFYMVASSDRSINPQQERMMAKRAHAKTVQVKASHVAFLSRPMEAAKLIEEAAGSAHVNEESTGLYVARGATRARQERFGAKAFEIENQQIRADL
jgi:hypothetical protein